MLTFAIENLNEFTAAWRGVMGQLVLGIHTGVAEGLRAGVREALSSRRWKDRTGQTAAALQRSAVSVRNATGAEGLLECKVPWASFLSDGTEPHEIHPKAPWATPRSRLAKGQTIRGKGKNPEHVVGRGTFLRWKDEGMNEHFARVVHHPGTQMDNFFLNGQIACEKTIKHEVEASVPAIQRRWLDS